MFRVWWQQSALDEVASLWISADTELRRAITEAVHQIDVLLARDPLGKGESRPDGRRLAFVAPLGFYYRLEDDEKTVVVLQTWLFRKRGS